jgi:hypothetical protein
MTVKFTNNASTTVGTGINASATSLTVASASSFPQLSGADDYCYLTIQGATNTTREVVKATALSSNTFTIVRAQDNTSAGTWAAGDVVELRMTAALLTDVIDAATVEGVKTNYQYTPTAGQTVFSGADNASATMIINQAALVSVYMNGVRLVQGTDYSVSSANNTVTLGIGATTADIIDIEVYGNFVGQSGAAVGITGGSITGTAITATSLGATGTATLNTLVSNNATISGGSLNGVTIGGTTAGTGRFSSLAATGNATFSGDIIADSNLRLRTTDDQANQWYVYTYTDDTLRINYNGAGADALIFDTSENATFSGNVNAGAGLRLYTDGSNNAVLYALGQNKSMYFVGDDAGVGINALVLDMQNGGNATFSGSVTSDGLTVSTTLGDTPASIVTTTGGSFLQFTDGNTTAGRSPLVGAITDDLLFYTNAGSYSEKLRISAAGNLLSGTGVVKGSRVQAAGAAASASPTLGSATDTSLLLTNSDVTYGMNFGVINNGNGWIQQHSNTGTASAYNLLLQPVGGYVGIGTSSPSVNTEIRGSASNGQLRLGGSTTATYANIYSDNDGVLILGADAGNNAANSYFGVEVDGAERIRIDSAGVTTFKYNTKVYTAGYPETRLGISDSNYFNFTFDNPNDALAIGKNGSAKMTLTASGFLGLGASPAYPLHLYVSEAAGTDLDTTFIYLQNPSDGGAAIEFTNGVAAKGKIAFAVDGTGSQTDETDFTISTSTANGGALTDRLLIDAYGNFIIKTISGAATAIFGGTNLVNGITAVPSNAGTPFVVGRDTGTNRSAHFAGHLKFDSGYGVQFSVAGGTGTSTSGTLSDYEEGTWTPTIIGGSTSTTFSGRYTKIGRMVYANFYSGGFAITSASGAARIGGLPFTVKSTGNGYGASATFTHVTCFSDAIQTGYCNAGTNYVYPTPAASTANTTFSNSSLVYLMMSVAYEAA